MGEQFVQSVGVELECFMTQTGIDKMVSEIEKNINERYGDAKDKEKNLEVFKHLRERFINSTDGSLRSRKVSGANREIKYWCSIKELDEMEILLKSAYVGMDDINWTCGYHMHLGMDEQWRNTTTFQPFNQNFINKYKSRYVGNQKYMDRLFNYYCKPDYEIPNPMNKYTAINNLHSNTVEVRIMPYQETAEEAMETLKWTVDTTDRILEELSKNMKQVFSVPLKKNKKKENSGMIRSARLDEEANNVVSNISDPELDSDPEEE